MSSSSVSAPAVPSSAEWSAEQLKVLEAMFKQSVRSGFLNLNGLGFGAKGASKLGFMARTIRHCMSGRNRGKGGLSRFASFYCSLFVVLVSLSLQSNSISSSAAFELSESLGPSSSLHFLDFSGNPLGSVPLEADPEKDLENLKKRDFSRKSIALKRNTEKFSSDENLGLFFVSLCEQSKLQSISLRSCGLGPRAMKSLVDALELSSSIQSLDLEENCIGDAGAAFLLQALEAEKLSNLRELRVRHSRISPPTLGKLYFEIARNRRKMEEERLSRGSKLIPVFEKFAAEAPQADGASYTLPPPLRERTLLENVKADRRDLKVETAPLKPELMLGILKLLKRKQDCFYKHFLEYLLGLQRELMQLELQKKRAERRKSYQVKLHVKNELIPAEEVERMEREVDSLQNCRDDLREKVARLRCDYEGKDDILPFLDSEREKAKGESSQLLSILRAEADEAADAQRVADEKLQKIQTTLGSLRRDKRWLEDSVQTVKKDFSLLAPCLDFSRFEEDQSEEEEMWEEEPFSPMSV